MAEDSPQQTQRGARGGNRIAARLLDPRVTLGAVLILASVLGGLRLTSTAQATTSAWAAAGDLAAGTQVRPEDLVLTPIPPESAAVYFGAGDVVEGRLVSGVAAGEFLARSAIEAAEPGDRLVVVAVAAERLGPHITRGSSVDVWQTPAQAGTARRVAEALTVADVGGADQWSGATVTVTLHVAQESVGELIAATHAGEVDLVARGDQS